MGRTSVELYSPQGRLIRDDRATDCGAEAALIFALLDGVLAHDLLISWKPVYGMRSRPGANR